MSNYQLSTLIQSHTPTAVWAEIRLLLSTAYPTFDSSRLYNAYINTARLYNGRYPGYRSCNTRYHDFSHASESCLALTRIIYGAKYTGRTFSHQNITTSLIAALLHDAGFIQTADDTEGTGAKYTATHVTRSESFLAQHAEAYDLSDEDVENGRVMILHTDLTIPMESIETSTADIKELGEMLGAADLLAQMADRHYLEKLLYLYDEFEEADLGNYVSSIDMLQKTISFFDVVDERLRFINKTVNNYLVHHFRKRWQIDRNLYTQAINNHHTYLKQVLATPNSDPRHYLRRDPFKDMRNNGRSHG